MTDRSRAAGMLLLAACLACARDETDLRGIAAHVGDRPVSLRELEDYFELNLLTDDVDEMDTQELNRVKSRLLDALLDEKIVLIEAARRGIQVGDHEIDAVVGRQRQEPEAIPPEQQRALVRDRIMIRKLMEQVDRHRGRVSDAEVRTYLERTQGPLAPSRRLRLRALRFDSAATADAVYAAIRAGKTNFAEAVANHGSGPDQGVPLEMSWNNLSEELQSALADLQPGQVSRPVGFHGETFVFQLESWLTDPATLDGDRARRARDELERRHRRQVHENLLRRLRGVTPVRIHTNGLPFEYVPET